MTWSIRASRAASPVAEAGARAASAARRAAAAWLVPALLLLAWEAEARAGLIPPNLLPPFSDVLVTLYDLARTGDLWFHVQATLGRVAAGFVLGAVVATGLGALTGTSSRWRALLDPTLQALRSIPSIAWVPLFILWLGIAEASKVALIAVGVFFPVYLNLMTGIAKVDRKLIEVGRAYRMEGRRLVRRVLLPASLPAYMVGLRGGLGLGWMFVVAAELMGASEGLGFLLIDGQMTGRPALVIASLIVFALVGKATDRLLESLARRLLVWLDTTEVA